MIKTCQKKYTMCYMKAMIIKSPPFTAKTEMVHMTLAVTSFSSQSTFSALKRRDATLHRKIFGNKNKSIA